MEFSAIVSRMHIKSRQGRRERWNVEPDSVRICYLIEEMVLDTNCHKIKNLQQTKDECERLKASGQKIVFTNGCFDILHPGHTRTLCAAKKLGDHLVVAVNSDRSVAALKGPDRPVFKEQLRVELLAALSCVDTVFIFDEDDPLKIIQFLLPDILVKGGDWTEKTIIGADVVKAAGGQVKPIPYINGFSTTDIINKIRG